jgi:predicted DCC family thiol-disulfide oxidoreductase YuxK
MSPAPVTPAADLALREPPIVFFDGVCGLCNRFVDFVLRHDRVGTLRLSPLQGETAERLLTTNDREQLATVIFWDNDCAFRRSAAVVRVCWRLGTVWKVLGGALWCIPLPLRDLGYKLVAANRYRLFGKKETCRLPSPEERARFLP